MRAGVPRPFSAPNVSTIVPTRDFELNSRVLLLVPNRSTATLVSQFPPKDRP